MKMLKETKLLSHISNILILLFLVAGLASCMNQDDNKKEEITAKDVVEEYDEAMQESRAYLNQEQKEMLSEMEERYTSLEKKVDQFAEKAAQMGDDANEEIRERQEQLQKQQQQLRAELDTLSNSSEEGWEEIKIGVDKAFDDLDKAVDNAMEEFSDAI
jgi:DNA topoisomerase VI subunit B